MILPLDTKDPLPSDDEDEYIVPPSPPPRAAPHAYTRYDADDPYAASGEDVPFLWSPAASPDDIELAPPPYTAVDQQCSSPCKSSSPLYRLKAALARAKFFIAALYLAIALYLVLGRRRHHRFGPPGGPMSLPFGGAWGRPTAGRKPDGVAVACASFSAAQWAQGAAARSANATFLLPTHAGAELFAHLHGPAAVGPVFVTTFDGDSDAEHAAATSAGAVSTKLRKGEYVRLTVEAVYDAVGLGDSTPATAATSAGWAMLETTDVCLMQRTANSTSRPHDWHNHWFAKPGLGVGIYTDSANGTAANGTSPLSFRMHIALPVVRPAIPKPASFISTVLSTLKLTRPVQPHGAIPPLSIRSGESDIFVADLRAARLGGLVVESKLGDMVVEHVRAESVRLSTLGTINANVTASHMVAVSTPSGKVDLDVSVGRSPAYTFFPHHRHQWSHKPYGSDADCALPPLAVDVSVNNANATVRHSGWEVPCRRLSERIRAMVGSVEAYHHPLYQGPFRFAATVGQIDVGVARGLADPLGLGRVRNVTLDAHEGVTAGRAVWVSPSDGDDVPEASERGDVDAPHPPQHPNGWGQHRAGLTIEASVGSVRVEL